tara:strand:- start:475 stop:618 length:144 start_codon:yes stop_codon:yes gene_type:complete
MLKRKKIEKFENEAHRTQQQNYIQNNGSPKDTCGRNGSYELSSNATR